MTEKEAPKPLEEVIRQVVTPGHQKAVEEHQQYLKNLAERNKAKFTKEEKK